MFFWSRFAAIRALGGAALVVLLTAALYPASVWSIHAVGLGPLYEMRALFLPILIASVTVTLLHDRMPLAWTGLGIDRWTLKYLIAGLLVGGVAALLAWVPSAVWGAVAPHDSRAGLFMTVFLFVAIGAVSEELIFRGYIFLRAVETIGTIPAVLFSSLVFAAAHLSNPSVTPLAIANVFLAGLLFSAALLRSGTLWLPMALHVSWNGALSLLLGAPVSGIQFGTGLLRTDVGEPTLLTGGDFGPEGGIAASAALILAAVAVVKWRALELSPYVHATIFRSVYQRQMAGREG